MSHLVDTIHQLEPVLEPVLAHLRPLMSHLPPQLVAWGRTYYTPAVFDPLILQLDVFNQEHSALLQQFISKTLSLGILSFSSIVKLPQILAIVSQSSARGLSFLSIALETASYLISVAYNLRKHLDFMTFGETIFVAIQNVIILLLILYYTNKAGYINGFIGFLALAVYALFANPANPYVLSNKDVNDLAHLCVPLTVFSKLPQIIGNFKAKSTGALSIASVGAGLLGTIVRLFTVLSSGIDDKLILTGFLVSVGLNVILFLQILVFGKGKKVSTDKKNN